MSVCYEIDFLPAGNSERCGDAICVRYGSPGNYKVMVYDGGTEASGEALARHIRAHYDTNVVDYVVCSHPDADHAASLSVILEMMEVQSLWMHRPWAYSAQIGQYFKGGRIHAGQPMGHPLENMAGAFALEALAAYKGIPLYEPFQGERIGEFTVLSPSREWYVQQLIADFEGAAQGIEGVAPPSGLLRKAFESVKQVSDSAAESWDIETLREGVRTSAENESSVVLFGMPADRGVLLTGDAGTQALARSATYAESIGVSLPDVLKFVQIPNHGNGNNVSPSVLDRLIGLRSAIPLADPRLTAFVSTCKDSKTLLSKAVTNAFMRRGARVVVTKGEMKCHGFNMEPRDDWVPVTSLPFSAAG